ncbi:MAG: 2-phospho-L-lactate guanylyltransferase [Deltaproteobacteria bacterium]|nr:2-phospho-L-lactate guanylyltransferase [Deltaproteobacteria bacterium]
MMKFGALIPVKGFHGAKQRLSSRLSPRERSDLMKAMVHDVLAQVTRAHGIHRTWVVTGSDEVARWVSAVNVTVIREQDETGETDAVHYGLDVMKQAGIDAALVVPGDIPLLCAGDVESVLRTVPESPVSPFAILVPSHDRMGTNALLLAPPDVLRLRFGYDSFRYHLSEAGARGASVKVIENSRIALDIDEPADLQKLIPRLEHGRTHDRLAAMRDNGSGFFAQAS